MKEIEKAHISGVLNAVGGIKNSLRNSRYQLKTLYIKSRRTDSHTKESLYAILKTLLVIPSRLCRIGIFILDLHMDDETRTKNRTGKCSMTMVPFVDGFMTKHTEMICTKFD